MPSTVPASTPRTLSARILAAILATAIKTPSPLEVVPGYIDTSGYGGGPNVSAFAAFPDITPELLRPQPQDLFGQPEYRFWFLTRNNTPIFVVEQAAGLGWTRHTSHSINLMGLYTESRRDLTITALKLLRRIENI